MKKALFTVLILTVAALTAGAFAQSISETSATASHLIKVNLPAVVALNVVGDTSGTDLSFNPTASEVYNSANSSTGIPAATGGFQDLYAFTNDASEATLSVDVTDSASTTASAAVLGALQLKGGAISAYTAQVAPGMPQSVINRSDFSLHLTGTEPQGNYTYTITYTLTAN